MKHYLDYIERSDLNEGTHIRISVFFGKGGFYAGACPVTKNAKGETLHITNAYRHMFMAADLYTDNLFELAVAKSGNILPAMIERILTETQEKAANKLIAA